MTKKSDRRARRRQREETNWQEPSKQERTRRRDLNHKKERPLGKFMAKSSLN
jgi:hypothetical protein